MKGKKKDSELCKTLETDFQSERYLDGCDLYPPWIPSLPLPPFDTHRAETQQTDSPVTLTHFHSIQYLRHSDQRFSKHTQA